MRGSRVSSAQRNLQKMGRKKNEPCLLAENNVSKQQFHVQINNVNRELE
jgi:siroheme synthase